MRLGIDFDNTIVRYDRLFHTLAVERGLIPAELPANKTAVRDHLRSIGKEDDWTELQGLAYGPEIVRADPFPGVIDFLHRAHALGLDAQIVSHKTRTPYRGEPHDLHAAARSFLALNRIEQTAHLEPTKEDKLARIGSLQRTHFIDDLPEFLIEPSFPADTQRLLFDPNDAHGDDERYTRVGSWDDLAQLLLTREGVDR